jgi:prepilin-type processing-associated H-X9-DG protein/prepilin-type N-terminal cleavage/methylation domain-containing protein
VNLFQYISVTKVELPANLLNAQRNIKVMKRYHFTKLDCRQSAFSLVEALVVIAIIALLAAMIAPAVSKAKDRAWTVQCVSNERQLGFAIAMYAGDHNDSYPWFTFTTQYRQWSVLNSYLGRSRHVFKCPAAHGKSPRGPYSLSDWTYEPVMPLKLASTITNADGSTWVTDYKFNDSSRFYQTNEFGQIVGNRVGLNQMRPQELVVDWDNLDWQPRHISRSKVNFGFLDGHVAHFSSSGERPSMEPDKAMTGTYTVDSIGNYPFWNWGFPDVFVTKLDPPE